VFNLKIITGQERKQYLTHNLTFSSGKKMSFVPGISLRIASPILISSR